MIDLIFTLLFCLALYRLGMCTMIDGRFVALGIVLWLIGWLEGRREKKHGDNADFS